MFGAEPEGPEGVPIEQPVPWTEKSPAAREVRASEDENVNARDEVELGEFGE